MLERSAGLTESQLNAIGELERAVVANDGGRLKLEWGVLQQRDGEQVNDLLWWRDGRLVGFIGLYDFGAPAEVAGMVAPDARGTGIGGALLQAALAVSRERGREQVLLVVPRPSLAGRRLALAHGGSLDHCEHALTVAAEALPPAADPSPVSLRPAAIQDVGQLCRLLEDGFGYPVTASDEERRLNRPGEQTMMIERDGDPVGTIRLTREGPVGRVYGFVIDPALQGRGLGRAALQLACDQLAREGASEIGLEVAVDNDRALGLYTSVGFAPVITEDYYRLSTAAQST